MGHHETTHTTKSQDKLNVPHDLEIMRVRLYDEKS